MLGYAREPSLVERWHRDSSNGALLSALGSTIENVCGAQLHTSREANDDCTTGTEYRLLPKCGEMLFQNV